ncbi:unnamed protein product, partial [Darwinula stevensoni]
MVQRLRSFYARQFPPPENIQRHAHVKSMEEYRLLYEESISDPEKFWKKIARNLYFKDPPGSGEDFLSYNFDIKAGPIFTKWMSTCSTNICYNALDYNVQRGLGEKVAFYWSYIAKWERKLLNDLFPLRREGNHPNNSRSISYKKLLEEVSKFSNVLLELGVKKCDKVAIYLPIVVELIVAMLACTRIGAVHSVVFGGFSAGSLAERIIDAKCSIVITADGVWRGKKLIHLKAITDDAIERCARAGFLMKQCIVLKHLPRVTSAVEVGIANGVLLTHLSQVAWKKGRDFWWHELMKDASPDCPVVWRNGEDPLFILYTSGSSGKPKGVQHTLAGYMLYAWTTFKYTFDYQENDVYWCTADIGWITGHTYITYGPLLNGCTTVLFEGIPDYPDHGRFWAVIDKYKVNKFYTAPTVIRSLMKFGEENVQKYSRSSLKLLGIVGEPINPEAWYWFNHVVGDDKCPIVDTFWQTETGGHVIAPLPGATVTKPGSATFPFFGVLPAILDRNGAELTGECEGSLAFKRPWPGIIRMVHGDYESFERMYFQEFPGYYSTGDGARRDKDGYIWVTGRIDDMLNVSGHLLSTTEVESALEENPCIAEAAVVPHPHSVKGQCLYCFVTLVNSVPFTDQLVKELREKVREKIGSFAVPDYVQYAPSLPKTRSGKIMRRILKMIAQNVIDLGDTSTLADESIVELLRQNRIATL